MLHSLHALLSMMYSYLKQKYFLWSFPGFQLFKSFLHIIHKQDISESCTIFRCIWVYITGINASNAFSRRTSSFKFFGCFSISVERSSENVIMPWMKCRSSLVIGLSFKSQNCESFRSSSRILADLYSCCHACMR